MAFAEASYAGATWAGYGSLGLPPPNQTLPPPIPGGSVAYYYSTTSGLYPWAYASWAMAPPQIPLVVGGVVAIPHQDTGVVEVRGWWPGATVLHVIRVHDDGSLHPVRGGYGVTVVGSTRTNYSQNPSFETGLNGVVTDAGTPTLSRIDSATDPTVPFGQYALRAVIAGAGSNGITIPTSLTGALPVTIGFQARFSDRPTGVRVVVSWTDGVGTPLSTNTVNVTAADINTVVAQWGRLVATLTPPTNAVTPTVKIIGDGLPAGASMDIDGITIEAGTAFTDGSQFDGGSLAGSWAGTPDLSASTLSPIQIVYDGEAPLDVPITYIVADPRIVGGQVESSPISLNSVGRFCWLTHPLSSSTPLRVDLRSVPVLEHGIEQGIFYPVGGTRAIVVSSPRREPATDLVINAVSFSERDALLALSADGMPLLLRAPARYGYTDTWWSLAAIVEDREGRGAYQDAMTLTAHAVAVYEPSPALVYEGAV